jgi:hypothetical protein
MLGRPCFPRIRNLHESVRAQKIYQYVYNVGKYGVRDRTGKQRE